jgi:tetratricopeptide (TPR) repeat protein
MKKFLLSFALLFFAFSAAFAQVNDEDNGVVYIKLANLLRRGHQTTLAQTYIKKGLPLVKGKDKFWEAAAYEIQGLIFRDLGDEENAQKFLLSALNLYTAEKNDLAEKGVSDILEGAEPNKELFAGYTVKTPGSTKEAFRLIKTASLLLEAKQFDIAKSCIEKSISFAKDKNLYWEASAYEHLGFIGWETENNQMAAQYLNMAQRTFQKNKNEVSAAVLKHLVKAVDETEELYGGIEIGSKGIKAMVLGVVLNKKGEYVVNTKFLETNSKAELSVKAGEMMANDKMEEAAWSVKFFYEKLLNEYGVADDRIFIVGSSAVASAKNAEALKSKIKASFPGDKNKLLHFTTPEQETEYGILGLVPDKKRFSAVLADIGGGNTVIGCMLSEGDKKTNSFALPYGSDNLQAMAKASGGDFNSAAKNIHRAKIEPELSAKIAASAVLKSRKDIYISGGGAWALTACLFPEKSTEQYVTLSVADVNKFRDMAALMYEKAVNPDLAKIADGKVRENAKADLDKVKEAFDKQTLTTATILLASAVNSLNGDAKDKKVIFARNGISARVMGFAVQFITDEYSRLSETK